jgi:hypothetical protein
VEYPKRETPTDGMRYMIAAGLADG